MNRFFLPFLFAGFFSPCMPVSSQIDYVSFEYGADQISSFHVTFKGFYSYNWQTTYFTSQDTLQYIFEWDFGDGSFGSLPVELHRYAASGTYDVSFTVTSITDPVQSFSDALSVTIEDTFEVPNVFTPDGDGNNDTFIVRSDGVTPLTISIFDRAGNLVYNFTAPVINWDGRTAAGILVKPGVYYYVITSSEPLYNKNGFVHVFYNR